MMGLIFGAVAGAFAAMYWHDDLKRMREKMGKDASASLRDRVADTVDSLEASVGEGLRSWSRTIRGGTESAPSIPERSQSQSLPATRRDT